MRYGLTVEKFHTRNNIMRLTVVGNSRYGGRDIVKEISDKVPHHVQIDELKRTFINGKVVRNEFLIGSLEGEAGQSLKIDIDPSSPTFMQGMDFATGEGVGGITKILMKGRGWTLPEVADHFKEYLDAPQVQAPKNPVQPSAPQPQPQSSEELPKPAKRSFDINSPHDGEYLYLSEAGEILFQVRRYIDRDEAGEVLRGDDGKAKKQCRQFPYLGDRIRPLYNLPDLLDSDRLVFGEGEKCA